MNIGEPMNTADHTPETAMAGTPEGATSYADLRADLLARIDGAADSIAEVTDGDAMGHPQRIGDAGRQLS
jgi:hypothetical protein